MTEVQPLVSIGIPTYNRARLLERAIESVLAQDYANIEVILSDNASDDSTRELSEVICRRDPRVRYIRQESNIGASANFLAVLRAANGEFFMWLADDDWLGPGYILHCLSLMLDDPYLSLVCGRSIHIRGEEFVGEGEKINLLEPAGRARVVSYYRQVAHNGAFYGLMRRGNMGALPALDTLGGDWLLVAAMAFFGKVRTIEDVAIYRSVEGVSSDMQTLVLWFGLTGLLASCPYLCVATTTFRVIGWQSPTYVSLGRAERLGLACLCAALVCSRHGIHYTVPRLRSRLRIRTRLRETLRRARSLRGRQRA